MDRIDQTVQKAMSAKHLPGLSLAIVKDGKVVLAKGYGVSNLELQTPTTEHTRFVVFSITKTFTATATMLLVEKGRIKLEDQISKFLPNLPIKWRAVTVRQLLTHTSGLPEYRDHIPELGDVRPDYSTSQVLGLIRKSPMLFPPGDRWEYTETNYYLLGLIIEKVSGMTYQNFVSKQILAPLGLRESRFDDSVRLMPNRADGYLFEKGNFVNAPRYSPSLTYAAAGLASTVLDLAQWDIALGKRLLKPATWKMMWTGAKLNNGKATEYGFGFGLTPFRGHRRIGHVGGGDGFCAALSHFGDDRISVIVCTNLNIGFDISSLANEIAALFFEPTPS